MSVYNSLESFYKTPFGAVKSGDQVTFRLCVPFSWGKASPRFFLQRAGGETVCHLLDFEGRDEDRGCEIFVLRLTAPAVSTYFYWFDLWVNFTKIYRGENGEGFATTETGTPYQLTVYEPDFKTPEAFKGGVMYQIFPDRFAEGHRNKLMPFADRIYRADKDGEPFFWPTEQHDGHLNLDYYGGDFLGIEQKLPYLAELGITCIYLNPIFEAHSNHRYNTADYLKPDPLLGTEEEFSHLCAAAKDCGILILLDGVFSHTGSDSVYFDKEGRYGSGGAYHEPRSRYRSWYDFDEKYPKGYRCWWGFETLPEVNEEDSSYRQFICGEGGVIDHWLKLGAGGFRLDVADELPDDFIRQLRSAVKRNGNDKLLLGEVWEDATNKESYGYYRSYLLGKGLDTVMNYPFRTAILHFGRNGNAGLFKQSILEIVENYPAPAMQVAMNILGTHDTLRTVTALAGEDVEGHDRYWQSKRMLSASSLAWGKKMMRLCYALLYMLPGIPCVYYGDEIAMQGYKDPFNRGFFDWNCQDDELRHTLKKLADARHNCSAFKDGELIFHEASGDVICCERRSGNAFALLLVNRSMVPILRTVNEIELVAGAQNFCIYTSP